MSDRAPTFLRASIGLLIAGGLALLAVVGASLWLADGAQKSAERGALSGATRAQAFRLQILMVDAETGQRGFLLTGSPIYLTPYRIATQDIEAQLGRLEAALAAEGRTAELGDSRKLVELKLAELRATLELAQTGRTRDALAMIRSDRGKALMDRLRHNLARIVEDSDERVAAESRLMLTNARTLVAISIIGGVLAVLFVIVACWNAVIYTRDLLRARAELQVLNDDLESRVADRTAELTRANEEIQRFAYIVSHDLRAPLVNVMGFTSELEEGLGTVGRYFEAEPGARDARLEAEATRAANDEMPEAIGFIRTSTRKMDSLINAILKISREGGRLLAAEPLDLKALIERQRDALRHQSDATGAEVEVTGIWPQVVSDRLALEQVFGNLLDNALKYLQPGRPGHVTIEGRDLGSRVEVVVRDNGRGVAEQDFERIFELFRRSGAQDQAGEGIGLAHVRALVRRLGGHISVESKLGEGTSFRVVLPKALSAEVRRVQA